MATDWRKYGDSLKQSSASKWRDYGNQVKTIKDFEGLQQRISNFYTTNKDLLTITENFMSKWHDKQASNLFYDGAGHYYAEADSIKKELEARKKDYIKIMGDDNYNSLYNSLNDIVESKNTALEGYKKKIDLFSKFENADDYNKAKREYQLDTKYGRLKTHEDYEKYYKSGNFEQANLPQDEKDYLLRLGYKLEYRDAMSSLNVAKQRLEGLKNNPFANEKEVETLETQIKNLEKRIKEMDNMGGIYTGLNTEVLSGANEYAFDQRWANKQSELDEETEATSEKDRIRKMAGLPTTEEENQKAALTDKEKIKLMSGQKVDKSDYYIDDIFKNAQPYQYLYYATDDEKRLYSFIKKRDGEGLAQKYLEDLKIAKLDKRLNQAQFKEAYDYSAQNGGTGLLGSLASIPINLFSGIEYVAYRMAGLDGVRSTLASKSQGFREGTKSQIDSDVWDFVYDTTMSGLDSAAAVGFSAVAPWLGEVVLASSAAASTYNDALDRGMSHGDALLTSLAAGVAESLFEHMSISKFLDAGDITKGFTKAGLRQTGKNILIEMGINASEEALTEVSNIVTDTLINGNLSNYAFAVKDYYEQGMSPEEAKNKALNDFGKQILEAGLSGALMGFGFGSISSFKGMARSQILNSRNGGLVKTYGNINELKTMADLSGVTEIKSAAEKLSESSKPSEIGYVYNSLVKNAVESSVKQMTPILLENGAKEGGSNSAKGWAEQIAKSVFVGKDSPTVANLLSNTVTKTVYSEFVKEGKYGGDTLLALKELASNPQPKAMTANDFINSYGGEGPAVSGEIKGIASAPRTGTIHPITEAFGKSVAENLERQRPTPQRPTKKKITKAGEAIVKAIGKAMGVEVEFTDSAVDGVADGKTVEHKKVYISRYTVDPIKEVIKHEFTHTTEISKHYGKFQKYLFDESEAFKTWLRGKGYTKLSEMQDEIYFRYKKHDPDYEYNKTKTEIVAKFVSENLFKDSGTEVTETFLKELYLKDRNLFDRFVDWVKSVYARLKANGAVNKDIIKLEQKFIRLAETAKKQRFRDEAKQGKGQYSINDENVIDLSNDNELSKAVEGVFGSQRYTAIQKYILNALSEQPIVLSDGKRAIVDKRDALHIANKSGKEKTAHISQIKKIIENSFLVAEAQSTKEGKFDYFYYYETAVKYDGDIYPLYLNVGRARNDATYHIYDITKKIRDTAHRVNDVGRPVGNALKSDISNSSIPNSSKNVKGQYSFAGENAKTADKLKLSTAKQMLKDGADSETIRKETGWFKGYDGKWRFEINDKEAIFDYKKFSKDMLTQMSFEHARQRSREGTISGAEFTKEAIKYFEADLDSRTLKDYVMHEELFEAYPELKDVEIKMRSSNESFMGSFDPRGMILTLNLDYCLEFMGDEKTLKETVIHEIQHAVQDIEGFARGASGVYWQARKGSGEVFLDENGNEISNRDLYERTAGEIEARDAASRIEMTDKQRKATRPDIDRTDVVFANKELVSASNNAQYSIPSDHNYVYTNGKASFTEERLNNLFDEHSLGNGKRAEHSNAYVAYISPEDFVSLTSNKNIRSRVEDEAYVLNEEELRNETETPFIEYDPASGEVVGHEGRHRMVALKADGITKVAVLLKPSTDSFEHRTVQDISLTGQNFAEGRAVGKVTVKTAVPLSEKYREKAIQKFAKNPDADVRYSIPDNNKKITPNMSESDRADILRSSKIDIVEYTEPQDSGIDFEYLENSIKSKAEKHLLKKLQSLGYLKHYTTRAIDVEFDFTMGGLRKSTHSQLEYGGNYSDFTKVVVNLQELLDASILIESHTDKAKGTPRENPQLKQVYVLLSALNDGENIIPVQFEIKQFIDDNNRLYLAVALTKIETGVMGNTIPNNSQVSTNLLPISNISIPELFSKINPKDKKFLKYVPDEFLNEEQKVAKQEALKEDAVKYAIKIGQYSIPDIARGKTAPELWEMSQKGEITSDDALKVLAEQHGEMPKGENPKVDVTLPEQISKSKNVNQFMRNVLESGHLDADMSETEKRNIISGARTYKPISDKAALSRAESKIKTDVNGAVQEWENIINSGKRLTKFDVALGEQLLVQAADTGNANDVTKYIAELADIGTQSGQVSQALRLLKQMTGIGQLYYVTRTVARLNKDIEARYGEKHKIVEIDPHLAKILANSKSEAEIDAVVEDLIKDVASQVKSSWVDKFNSWRYLAMLGNPRTHVRNVVGNGVFLPAVGTKNKIAALAEKVFIDKENRTKTFGLLKPEYRAFATKDFEKVEDIIKGGGKMNPTDQIRDQMKVYNSKAFAWLEKARQFNFDMLEKEDALFLKGHYIRALGGAIQARGLDVNNITPAQLEELRTYAIKEAQKATFRDVSHFAQTLNKLAHPGKDASIMSKAAGVAVEGLLPFKKTPINILKRGIEYSPVGIATSIAEGFVSLREANRYKKLSIEEENKGNKAKAKEYAEIYHQKKMHTAAELIDGLSAGLTGTGIMLLGALCWSLGFISGGMDYDDEEALERIAGKQPYAINFGNFTYTIDFAAPAVLPFMIGAETAKMFNNESVDETLGFFDAVAAIGAPMTELSMLQGLNDAIETIAYSDNKMGDFATNIFASYFSQYIPTIGGQIARTFDDTRRTNFIDKDSAFPKIIQTTYQKALGKIPYFENKKVPYIDAWGRTEENDNILLRAFENFISPGYISTVQDDKVNNELAKVYTDTGKGGVIPKRAKTSFEVDGETVNLSADEYVQYATDKGQYSRQYLEEVMSNPLYQGLPSEGKAAVISNLYSFANAKAKTNVSDYDYTTVSTYKTAAKLEAAGISPASYYIAREVMSKENADTDGSDSVSGSEKKKALRNAGFSSSEINTIVNINKK